MQQLTYVSYWHRILLTLAWCGSSYSVAPPSFHFDPCNIDRLYQQLTTQHQRRANIRYWYKVAAVTGIIVGFLLEQESMASLKKKIAQQTHDLSHLNNVMQQAGNVVLTEKNPAQPVLRTISQYAVQLLTKPIKAVWSGTKYLFLMTLVQKCIGALVDPFLGPMGSTATLAVADSWFLQEQVPQSRVTFVVIREEVTGFIRSLNTVELMIQRLHNLKKQGGELTHVYVQDVLYEGEKLIAHMSALQTLFSGNDEVERNLILRIQQEYVRCLEHFCNDISLTYHDQGDIDVEASCSSAIQQLRQIIRPLPSVSIYQIMAWPFSVALQESLLNWFVEQSLNPLNH